MKRKILFIFIFFASIFLGGILDVSANTYTDKFNDVARWIPNIYIAKEKDGVKHYRQMTMVERKSDGSAAYCIEPALTANSDAILNGVDENQWVAANLTKEEWTRLELLAYYGYGYQNHTDLKWYAITQMMMWEEIPQGYEIYFTEGLNGERTDKYKKEMEEIERLIQNHGKTPKFEVDKVRMQINGSVTLSDTNSVLSSFNLGTNHLVEAKKEGNQLVLTAKQTGKTSLSFTKEDKNFAHPVIVYVDDTFQNVLVRGAYAPVNAFLEVEVIGGSITLEKKDFDTLSNIPSGNATLKGAIYEVFTSEDVLMGSLTTDEKGYVKGDFSLGLGEYYLKEKVAPSGYQLDNRKHYFTITTENLHPTISVTDKVIRGKIQIQKVDSENLSATPQGSASLNGAKFGIYDSKEQLVDTLITNSEGIATSIELPFGKYKIKELESSTGYLLNTETFSISIQENLTYSVTIKEEVIKNEFQLYKYYGNTAVGEMFHEENATFEVIDEHGQVFTTLVTDTKGFARVILPFGTYIIRQVQGLEGYHLAEPFTIVVNETSSSVQTTYLKDEEVKARLKLVKVDAYSHEIIKLAGIKFKIRNRDTQELICQTTDKVICEFETNSDGIFLTPLPLSKGNYEIIEVLSPDGYLLKKDPVSFSILDVHSFINDTTYGPLIEIQFENIPIKGKVTLEKYGEKIVFAQGKYSYQKILLDGVRFSLYAAQDIYSADLKLQYRKDEWIKTEITKNGYLSIDELFLGEYYFIEESSVLNHVVDKTKHYFTISAKDSEAEVILKTLTIQNQLPKRKVEIIKLDALTKKPIPNTELEVYTKDKKLIFRGMTNNEGKLILEDLFFGEFYIVETTPAEGYLQLEENVVFVVDEHSESTLMVTVFNEKEVEVPKTGTEVIHKQTNSYFFLLRLGILTSLLMIKKQQ